MLSLIQVSKGDFANSEASPLKFLSKDWSKEPSTKVSQTGEADDDLDDMLLSDTESENQWAQGHHKTAEPKQIPFFVDNRFENVNHNEEEQIDLDQLLLGEDSKEPQQ